MYTSLCAQTVKCDTTETEHTVVEQIPSSFIVKKQVIELRTQILREADDDNIEEMTCQTDMCYRISDNDSNGWGWGDTNNNVTNQEGDRKKNVLATFLLAMYAATISFMYIITHS